MLAVCKLGHMLRATKASKLWFLKVQHFIYWDTVLDMKLPVCIVPELWYQNYARWFPIHVRDMQSLPTTIYQEFMESGNWVIQKTKIDSHICQSIKHMSRK